MGTVLTHPSQSSRIVQLDALRGLAALVVVFHHLRYMFDPSPGPFYLQPLVSGGKSVMLFFVLSGYVLSLPYWRGRQLPYGAYLVRRICRIYLPYVAALCLAVIVGRRLISAELPLSYWFYQTWHTPLSRALVVHQLFFLSYQHSSMAINTAFWSLRYEMEMSLIFPFVCYLIGVMPTFGAVGLAMLLELIGMGHFHWLSARIPSELQTTILWASAFVFGAILSKERVRVISWYHRLLRPVHYILFLLIVLAYYRGAGTTATTNIPAACGVIILAEGSRARFWLETRVVDYLGKISYSLYLVHGTVLFATFILLYGKLATWGVVVIYLVTSLLLSHLFCEYIELPSMKLGKWLTQKKLQTSVKINQANSGHGDNVML